MIRLIIIQSNNFSLQIKKRQARNDEYNEFLKQNREKEKHRYDSKKQTQVGVFTSYRL